MKSKTKTWRYSLCYFFIFGIAGFFLSSCAKQSLTYSWRNESLPAIKVEDVLVIGMAKGIVAREMYENAFVEGLQAENVKAYRSYKVKGKLLEPTKEALLEVIQKTDAKTVLITYITDEKRSTTTQHGDMFIGFFYRAQPRVSYTQKTLYLESIIYDVKSEKLLWSGRVTVREPRVTNKDMRKITALFVKGLKKEGLL